MDDTSTWDYGLSSEQAAAASHFGSHARLLAGPGTGKTHTLTSRVVYLVTERGIEPRKIFALTFTRVATGDLRAKIAQRLSPHTDERPLVSTLHSFALRQLLRNSELINSLPQPLHIADDWEEREIVQKDLMRVLNCNRRTIKELFQKLAADWETLRAEADNWEASHPNPEFIGAWKEHRSIYGYTLRSELVYQLKRALEEIEEFRLDPNVQHVLIDEFQDLNPCDLEIANSLAEKGATLLVCGDDDQSIYGFRFADPSGIREFPIRYAGSVALELSECRRCDEKILASALWVARQDPRRVDKNLHSATGHPEITGEVRLLRFREQYEEATGIARMCKTLVESGTKPGEILILVRGDRHKTFSTPIRDALAAMQLEAAIGTEPASIMDERPGRSFLSLLKIMSNDLDSLAWRSRIQNAGGIGDTTISAIYDFARRKGCKFAEAVFRLNEFRPSIPTGQIGRLEKLIDVSLAKTASYNAHLEASSDLDDGEKRKGLLDFVKTSILADIEEGDDQLKLELHFAAMIQKSGSTTLSALLGYLTSGDEISEPELDPTRINILTMHRAKGLSADVVFVVGVEDESLPFDVAGPSVDDDRRLLYVSMTRARHRLYLTFCSSRVDRQLHSGRTSGQPRRNLTRFLTDGPLQVELGRTVAEGFTV